MKKIKMTKTKIVLLIHFLVLGTMLLTCVKHELENEKVKETTGSANSINQVLSKVLVDNQPSTLYVYNSSKLLVEEQSKDCLIVNSYDKTQLIATKFYVNDNILSNDTSVSHAAIKNPTWITKETGVNTGNLSYAYNDKGLLFETKFSSSESDSLQYSDYTYDSNNRIIKEVLSYNKMPVGYIDYNYDMYGNLISEALYNTPTKGVDELLTKTEYMYDTMRNPYRLLNTYMKSGLNTNANNIIQETYTIHRLPSDTVQITKYSYTYKNNYPITKNGNISFQYQ